MRISYVLILLLAFAGVGYAEDCKKCKDKPVKVEPVKPAPKPEETALSFRKDKQKPNGKVKRFSLRLGKGCRCK